MHDAFLFLIIIGLWFFVQTWVLPKLGIRT
jgi:hypothetical protein